MAKYMLIAMIVTALCAGCREAREPFEIGQAVLEDERVTVEVKPGAGQRVTIGILLVEDSPLLMGGDPLEARLLLGGLRVNGGPVNVLYGEVKDEYFPERPEGLKTIAKIGLNRTMPLPGWVVERIHDGGVKCVLATEGAGTKDNPRAEPTFWLRPITIAATEQPEEPTGEQPAQSAEPEEPEEQEEAGPADPGQPEGS